MKSMSERRFLDTNVLVYADDSRYPEKQKRAVELIDQALRENALVLSAQVLQEYFVAITGKLGVPVPIARSQVSLYRLTDVILPDVDDILAAIDLHQLRGFSFWDCLVIRTALIGRCSVLYSEDLQHGQRIDSLTIVDPFRA
jgi:predicted nucleic acid-binding protein